jgi:UV DNA damage endonuclease
MESKLGLVCITRGKEIRYRTITRTRFRALSPGPRERWMRQLYRDNLDTLFRALDYCKERWIKLYRITSDLFPMNDYALGKKLIAELAPRMQGFAGQARQMGIRVLSHPDQFVVITSESKKVTANSIGILQRHARIFDLLGLPRSPWAPLILHGGKRDRHETLKEIVPRLPENIRNRLVFENDERAYGAEEILEICQSTGTPMVFDLHHHVVKEKLSSYEHSSIAKLLRAARSTWPRPDWQIIHVSNGQQFFGDPRHSETIEAFPTTALKAPWIEIEAKGKEEAIHSLRMKYPILH